MLELITTERSKTLFLFRSNYEHFHRLSELPYTRVDSLWGIFRILWADRELILCQVKWKKSRWRLGCKWSWVDPSLELPVDRNSGRPGGFFSIDCEVRVVLEAKYALCRINESEAFLAGRQVWGSKKTGIFRMSARLDRVVEHEKTFLSSKSLVLVAVRSSLREEMALLGASVSIFLPNERWR